jgi:peptidoglycan/LPS O-acetylase OafA/YrhL
VKETAATIRLDAVDGLRGIAIALVFVYHCWLVYGVQANVPVIDAFTKTGFLGVELFFALSGFCMLYPFAQAHVHGTQAPSWSHYAFRRAVKIFPSYFIALTVFAVLYAPKYGSHLPFAYLAHLTLLHPLFDGDFQSISGPLWTIGVEAQFYVIFPLFCGFILRRPLWAAASIVVIAEGYRTALTLTGHDTSFFWVNQVVAFLDIFAAGMFAAYLVVWYQARADRIPHRIATGVSAGAMVLAIAAMIVLSQSSAMNDQTDFFLWESHWRFSLSFLLFVIVASTSLAFPKWRAIIANPVFTFLALISYNLYLWQLEVLVQAQQAQVALPFAVAIAFAIATAITYLVEQPLLRAKFTAKSALQRNRGKRERGRLLPSGPRNRALGMSAGRTVPNMLFYASPLHLAAAVVVVCDSASSASPWSERVCQRTRQSTSAYFAPRRFHHRRDHRRR